MRFGSGLCVVSRRTTRRHILCRHALHRVGDERFASRCLDPPVVLDLSVRRTRLLGRGVSHFSHVKFRVRPFNKRRCTIHTMPSGLFDVTGGRLLVRVVSSLARNLSASVAPRLVSRGITSLSYGTTMGKGGHLSTRRMSGLVNRLLALSGPCRYPRKQPAVVTVAGHSLRGGFGQVMWVRSEGCE